MKIRKAASHSHDIESDVARDDYDPKRAPAPWARTVAIGLLGVLVLGVLYILFKAGTAGTELPSATDKLVPTSNEAISAVELPPVPDPPTPRPTFKVEFDEKAIEKRMHKLEANLRGLKKGGAVLETDEKALAVIVKLQRETRDLLTARYGVEPHFVTMELEFPDVMVTDPSTRTASLSFRMGPVELVPYSVYKFLEIVRLFQGAAFHRNGGHVLQVQVQPHSQELTPMAFQEYHKDFPHEKYTMGFAGRPGGPAFYISTVDNTRNHGPASQGSKSEADGCFAVIDTAAGKAVVERMRGLGGNGDLGFLDDAKQYITITSMKLHSANEYN